MTETPDATSPSSTPEPTEADRITAIQAVAERVESWHYSSEEGTVDHMLRKGFEESGVEVGDDEVAKLVAAIEANKTEGEGNLDVAAVLA